MQPFVIGIAGGTGSGKTTVARRLFESLHLDSSAFLDQDSYYKDLGHLSLEERKRINFDHPDSLDNDLLVAHIQRLVRGEAVEKPTYDFAAHTRAARTVRVEPRRVVLVEGILLFVEPRLREDMRMRAGGGGEAEEHGTGGGRYGSGSFQMHRVSWWSGIRAMTTVMTKRAKLGPRRGSVTPPRAP